MAEVASEQQWHKLKIFIVVVVVAVAVVTLRASDKEQRRHSNAVRLGLRDDELG